MNMNCLAISTYMELITLKKYKQNSQHQHLKVTFNGRWHLFSAQGGGGGLRTSFYQLNCDPLEFSLYTSSLEFPRNSLLDTPGKWLQLQTISCILVSNHTTPWISAVFFTPPPEFSKAFFTPLPWIFHCPQPPSAENKCNLYYTDGSKYFICIFNIELS